MGTKELLTFSPEMIEIAVIMGLGGLMWLYAMRELLRKNEDSEASKVVLTAGKKAHNQAGGTTLQLTYITAEQILSLTAEQFKEIPESEVDKLPTAMKDIFKRHRNEVMLADRAKNNK